MSERSGVTTPGRLHFTVGLPQSGKSTLANRWARNYEEPARTFTVPSRTFTLWTVTGPPYGSRVELHCAPRVVVAGDDFRNAIHGREYVPESEGVVFAAMDVATRALLRRGFDVLVDETCTTQSTLLRYLRLDQKAVPVFVDTPVEVCLERARASGR